jgi:pyruvate dehydrogenase E1 component alpha subunit
MAETPTTIDRRTLLKMMGAAGASATVISACGAPSSSSGGEARLTHATGLTGSEFGDTVDISTAGPGGNKNWRPGDALKYLPAERIPTSGEAADQFASLSKQQLLGFYRTMQSSRIWESTMKDLFLAGDDGLYGAFHAYVGEEAIASGVMGILRGDDYIASTHRGHGHLIAKGGDLNKMSAEIFFKASGYNKGYGGSMHITDMSKGILGMNGIVGASYYMAAGAGLRAKVRGTDQVSIAFFGDGASASPYYFSAVRSAVNENIPVIFVLENNMQYMGVPVARHSPSKHLTDYTKGLNIPHHVVDGNDVTAVYNAASQAVARARAGEGPSVIEGLTYRWYDHAGFSGARENEDGAMRLPYRTDEEVRGWISRDPITRYRTWLLDKALASEAEIDNVVAEVRQAVDASVAFARQGSDPAAEAGVTHSFSESDAVRTQFYNRKGIAT